MRASNIITISSGTCLRMASIRLQRWLWFLDLKCLKLYFELSNCLETSNLTSVGFSIFLKNNALRFGGYTSSPKSAFQRF